MFSGIKLIKVWSRHRPSLTWAYRTSRKVKNTKSPLMAFVTAYDYLNCNKSNKIPVVACRRPLRVRPPRPRRPSWWSRCRFRRRPTRYFGRRSKCPGTCASPDQASPASHSNSLLNPSPMKNSLKSEKCINFQFLLNFKEMGTPYIKFRKLGLAWRFETLIKSFFFKFPRNSPIQFNSDWIGLFLGNFNKWPN